MKKLISLMLILMTLTLPALAEEAAPVYVSITDDAGALVLAHAPVTLADADADGALTIHDALMGAHAAYHEQGADAYASVSSEFGLSMSKLWGVENGGSYGYYLNDLSAWSLMDPVVPGDHVKAYCFTDLNAFSDTYAFFAAPAVSARAGESIALTLSVAAFDANWAPITLPAEGAVITVNGAVTDAVTDAQGQASVTLTEAGTYTISALSETMTLVAPVCVITVE